MNRIPRAAEKLRVMWLDGRGEMICTKNYEGGNWHGEQGGNMYYVFSAHLRNSELCKIEVLEMSA